MSGSERDRLLERIVALCSVPGEPGVAAMAGRMFSGRSTEKLRATLAEIERTQRQRAEVRARRQARRARGAGG